MRKMYRRLEAFFTRILTLSFHFRWSYNSINKDYLLLSDLPGMVSVVNKVYCLQYSESFSGDVFKISDNEPFYTLKTALIKYSLPQS